MISDFELTWRRNSSSRTFKSHHINYNHPPHHASTLTRADSYSTTTMATANPLNRVSLSFIHYKARDADASQASGMSFFFFLFVLSILIINNNRLQTMTNATTITRRLAPTPLLRAEGNERTRRPPFNIFTYMWVAFFSLYVFFDSNWYFYSIGSNVNIWDGKSKLMAKKGLAPRCVCFFFFIFIFL